MKNLIKKIYKYISPIYHVILRNSRYKVLVSYITEPFFNRNNEKYLNGHQNRRETLLMADIFKELNCSAKFVRLDRKTTQLGGYDIVFGVEPNFVNACQKNPDAIKIYYATGAYFAHQDKMVISRTDEFNKKHNTCLSYSRRPEKHKSCEIADYIIQIGSSYTIDTYPEHLRKKIQIIRQTGHTFHFDNFINRKKNIASLKEFAWMGSGGSILKGLDIVLEYFMQHRELTIHIMGPIDQDVYDYYRPIINKYDNIIIHGFVDLNSTIMENIALKCASTIMLSGSEGCPGAVINMMKLGCIPIVSRYAAFNGLSKVGYICDDISIESLDKIVKEVLLLGKDEIDSKIEIASILANNTFNMDSFKKDLQSSISAIINHTK